MKIVLLIEPSEDQFTLTTEIGNLFINRLAIDENASFEIVAILELRISCFKMEERSHDEFRSYSNERNVKGMAQLI